MNACYVKVAQYAKKTPTQTGSVGDSTVTAVTDLVTSLQVPMVGPISGSPDLREPWRENVVNIRASVVDETKLLVNHMVTGLGMVRAMALWSDDATGANGLKALSDSLRVFGANVVANASYNPATGNVAQAFAWLDAASNSLGLAPQAIFLYGTQNVRILLICFIIYMFALMESVFSLQPVAQFIVQAHSRWPSAAFFATSSASADGLSQSTFLRTPNHATSAALISFVRMGQQHWAAQALPRMCSCT